MGREVKILPFFFLLRTFFLFSCQEMAILLLPQSNDIVAALMDKSTYLITLMFFIYQFVQYRGSLPFSAEHLVFK